MLSKYLGTEQAYKNGYEKGKEEAIEHGRWIEFKYDINGVVDLAYKCENCGNVEGFDGCNYCSNCGRKMDQPTKIIPESRCKMCTISPTGFQEDCIWLKNGVICKCDIPEKEMKEVYHGHWNKTSDEDYIKCSVCGFELFRTFLNMSDLKCCPKCGAILDGTKSC